MNLVQIFLCWSFILLLAKAHPGISKRESEQRPMKLSWVPVVEPSELTKAQSLMIDIQPFDSEKPIHNVPHASTRGRTNPQQQQQQSERVNKQRPRTFTNQNRQIPPEDDQVDKFTSVNPFIPGVIRHKPRPSRQQEEDTQNTKTRARQLKKNRHQEDDQDDEHFQPRSQHTPRNRHPVSEDDDEDFQPRSHTTHKNRQPVAEDDDEDFQPRSHTTHKKRRPLLEDPDEDDDDFQPRSQTTHKNQQPVSEDDDQSGHFRADKRHPFQGKEQNMPGETEGKRRKDADRSRVNKFQSSDEEDDENDDRQGGFTPVYLLDDPKQGGSSRHEDDDEERDEDRLVRAEPLEEFDGYYHVAQPKGKDEEDDDEDRDENRDDGQSNEQHKSMRKRPVKDVMVTGSRGGQDDQEGHFGFNHESDDGSERPARRETSKRRNARKERMRGRLETDSSNDFETRLENVANEGFGIGIGYLSEI